MEERERESKRRDKKGNVKERTRGGKERIRADVMLAVRLCYVSFSLVFPST